MRIAMIGSRGVPARYGGVETAVAELSARLATRGHEVTVYCRTEDYDEHPPAVRGIRTRYVGTPGGRTSGAFVQAMLATLDAMARPYDVIHFHAMGPTLFAPLPRMLGRRVVCTVQGRDDLRAKWGPVTRRLMRIAAWSTARVPQATIVVSRELQAEFWTTFGRETTYLPNGISPIAEPDWSLSQQHAAVRRRGLEPGRYLLNVGRLVPEKRVDVLLRGFAGVPGDVQLAIAGDSSYTSDFVAGLRAQANGDPRVHLLGPVYGPDIDALFRHAIGFVQASSLEGLPLVLLEACAYGLPVVVSDIGPHFEVVANEPGASVFAVGDAAMLTAQLCALLRATPTERLADAAKLRDHVLGQYDWESITDDTVTLYESLL